MKSEYPNRIMFFFSGLIMIVLGLIMGFILIPELFLAVPKSSLPPESMFLVDAIGPVLFMGGTLMAFGATFFMKEKKEEKDE